MTQRKFALPALLALTLAACQQPTDNMDIAIDNGVNAAEVANAEVETLPPNETNSPPVSANVINEAEDSGSEDPKLAFIPEQYRGRWGMVAADCTSTRGDNKGLITIGDTSIRFYESTATLVEQRPAIATGFAGFYRFAGEGQTWEKVVTLKRSGDRLTRADDEGSFNYKRC